MVEFKRGGKMIKHLIRVKLENFQIWLVWLLPRWLIKWATIRLIAYATTGVYGGTEVPKLSAMDALNRWDK